MPLLEKTTSRIFLQKKYKYISHLYTTSRLELYLRLRHNFYNNILLWNYLNAGNFSYVLEWKRSHKRFTGCLKRSFRIPQEPLPLCEGPYVIIVGPSLDYISVAYIVIDSEIVYETSSYTMAVELCIQCTQVFQQDYSIISNHV